GPGSKHVLAQMSFRFPRVEEGKLEVLHARLTPTILKSSLAREHIELPAAGYSKLIEARDYERTFGERWAENARSMWHSAASRMLRRPADKVPQRQPDPPSRVPLLEDAHPAARITGRRTRFRA